MPKCRGGLLSLEARGFEGKTIFAKIGLVPLSLAYPRFLTPRGTFYDYSVYFPRGICWRVVKKWYGERQIYGNPNIPSQPNTLLQQENRVLFSDGVTLWTNMSEEVRDLYRQKAKGKPFSGQNQWQKEWMLSGDC